MSSFAQLAVERVLNALPEGLLLALCAGLLLRLMGRQNSGTRFAVWFMALLGVIALPVLGSIGAAPQTLLTPMHAEITVPAFWASAFFLLWVVVACVALARVIAGVAQVRRMRRNCTEVPLAELDPALQHVLQQSRRPVRLLVSDAARVPAALGFRSPAIVLPTWALRDMTSAELQPILIHELAHLRRHDDWTNLLQKAVRAVLFFHPAVWWIDARLSLEREMACDDAVLVATGNPKAYAGCLIDLLERGCARRGWTMAQAAVARARDASVRIARILQAGTAASTRVGRTALGLTAALAFACSGVLVCAPHLLVFAPAGSAEHAQARPLTGSDLRLAAASVVPATFHPMRRAGLVHTLDLKAADSQPDAAPRSISAQRPAFLKRAAKPSPLVMASLRKPAAKTQTTAAPTLWVVETTEVSYASAPMAQPAASVHPVKQSSEDPAVQVQTLQFVETDCNGVHMQMIRVVMLIPAQNAVRPGVAAAAI